MKTNTRENSVRDELANAFAFDSRQVFIKGHWQNTSTGQTLPIQDPSTGQVVGEIGKGSALDIDEAVMAAQAASEGEWGHLTATERGRILMKMSALVQDKVETLARIEALDVGKPLNQSRNDARALARYFEFYAGACDKLTGETLPYQNGFTVYTLREPHGAAGIIIPWNYPMQIVGRAVGGALAAGNSCVVKPAEDASASTLAIAAIAQEAGIPVGALNVVTGLGDEVGAALSGHPDLDHVSFTGSVATGRLIQTATAANVKPVTLELGGKSPHIVFDDCDLDQAMPTLVNACMQNAGQTCSAASRVLAQRGIYDEVKSRMVAMYQKLVSGPALDDHDLGPLVSSKQKAIVSSYIEQGKAELNLAAEGRLAAGAPETGHYVRATLFSEVSPDHRLAQEEIFGPVQVLTPFADEEEAVHLANGTPYGLIAGVWTQDGSRQMRMARRIKSGQVFLNNYGAGGGVELPFGGVGQSGHGREKGFEALYEFTRLKTVAAFHGS